MSLKGALETHDYSVFEAANAAAALDMVKRQFFDILIVDYKLPDTNGIDLVKQALVVSGESVPIVVTGFSSLEIAVESMRIGAHDYLVKPINIDELKKIIENIVIEREELKNGKARLSESLKKLEMPEDGAVTVLRKQSEAKRSSPIQRLIDMIVSMCMQLKKYFWDID